MEKEELKKELIKLVKEKSLSTNVQRVLTSGRVSSYYIDAKMTTRPAVASAVMAAVMWWLRDLPWLLLIPVGGAVYLVILALIGGFHQPDMNLLRRLIPVDRLRARLRPQA